MITHKDIEKHARIEAQEQLNVVLKQRDAIYRVYASAALGGLLSAMGMPEDGIEMRRVVNISFQYGEMMRRKEADIGQGKI